MIAGRKSPFSGGSLHTNFTTSPQRRAFTYGIVTKNQAPLRVVGGEAEGLRRKELL